MEQDILTELKRIYLRVCLVIAVIVALVTSWRLIAFYVVGSAFAWWLLHSLTQAVRALHPGHTSSAAKFLWFKVWWRYPLAAILVAWVCRYDLPDRVAFIIGISMVPWLMTALAVRRAWHDRLIGDPPDEDTEQNREEKAT